MAVDKKELIEEYNQLRQEYDNLGERRRVIGTRLHDLKKELREQINQEWGMDIVSELW